jgi:Holliday junction resolvasome RuvABC endonuclease subunit
VRRVSGVDPSLTSTGLGVVTATDDIGGGTLRLVAGTVRLTTGVVKSDVTRDPDTHPAVYETHRVADIVEQVCRSVAGSELVYVESPALSSRTGKSAERAHLYFSLLAALAARRIPFDTMAPTRLKKRVTGSGRAGKDDVLAAVRRAWGESGTEGGGWSDTPAGGRHDRADAAALAWCAAVDAGWIEDSECARAATTGNTLGVTGEHSDRAA